MSTVIENTVAEKTVAPSDKKILATGIFWNFLQLVINQSFAFGLKLILAKLLFPSQFGLVGMATVFTGFVQVLNDLGVGAALVQRKKEDLRKEHYHTAFWTGVAWSVFLYAVMALGVANIAASFYNQPMLKSIIPAISIGILLSPINLVHKAQLTKQMNFKKLAFIDNTANITAGVIAIILAVSGAGVWALVFNAVATVVVAMPLFFNATRWKPAFIFEKKAFKEVFGFGIYTTGSNILNYLYNNLDYLLIGKLLGASALGIYTLAFVLTDTFRSRLMAVINNVMYPMYGKKQNDPESLKRYYLKVVLFNCLFIFPIMSCFLVDGDRIVVGIFGDKWQETVMPLRLLAVSVMMHILVSGNTALLRGLGRPGLEMRQQLLKAFIFLPSLAVGIHYYGIVGAAYAILLNKFVVVIVAQYTFNYLIHVKITFGQFVNAIKAPVIATVVAICVSLLVKATGLHFIITSGITMIVYAGCIWLLMKDELLGLINGLRKK
ncbi:lipopolysaccharide biosynthesis protein [Mucilaginibacter sp. JRF]|uniref:lipopolysaccharide biosynthesis protein n=1 Tax=Mucilaginibacter sp. JRF TaxID=2780088 RepID=UPI0018812676|nr:lipopolysaccharide biosynthesis protein [Mucilaginibacter sp. JRF]MBE9585876.1 lipopolysaccharide biosynthesis protein [Mucilaginibacter sp. JRF]